MRTTVNLDDNLLKNAMKFTGIQSKTELLNQALEGMIARHAALQLAKMGGSMPGLKIPPRRRALEDSKR